MLQSLEKVRESRNTALFGLLLLFFVQFLGMWIESTYRISLTRLGPGPELYGGLLLLLPLTLFAVRKEHERGVLWAVLALFLVLRVLCPFLPVHARLVGAGLGVALFLVLLAYLVSARYRHLTGDPGQAIALAILSSTALRSWGSSADVSMEGRSMILGWALTALCLFLFWASMKDDHEDSPNAVCSVPRLTLSVMGLFGTFSLVYLVFSCPMVVCAWSGYGPLGLSGVFASACLAVAIAMSCVPPQSALQPGRVTALAWNGLLLAALAGGLLAGRPNLPLSAEAGAVFVNGSPPFAGYLLYASLLLSPVVMVNVRQAFSAAVCSRPRNAVPALVAGVAVFLTTIVFLVATNVWGYVPYGMLLRNQFYLPFLVAGIAALLPWMPRWPVTAVPRRQHSRLLGGLSVLIALTAVLGALAHIQNISAAQPKHDLTVLTYNMQQGSHLNGNRNYLRQLDLLRRLNPDIIGLQESDTARLSGGNVDAVRYFAESLGYHAYYGPNSIAGTFGTAILSRYPIKNPRTFFTFSRTDEVGTAAAEIDVNGVPIEVFCNHPAGGHKVMQAHIDALIAEARKFPRVIALGDFNFNAREPYFSDLSGILQDSATTLGEAKVIYHGNRSSLADEIDHIFVSPSLRVLESHYLPAPDSETDHPAHWSVLRME